MRQKKQRSLVFILTLLTSLLVGGHSWLHAVPTSRAQTETAQLSESGDGSVTEPETRLDPVVARALLEQLRTAADDIQGEQKAKALIKIAQSYDRLSDKAAVEELSYEVLTIVNETLETVAKTDPSFADDILREAGAFSDEAIAYHVFNQILSLADTMEDEEIKSSILGGIIRYGNESFSNLSLVGELNNQVLVIISTMPDGLSKFHDLRQLSEIYHQRSDDTTAVDLVHQAIDALASLPNDSNKLVNLDRLTGLINSLANDAVDEDLLEHFLSLADTMQDDEHKARVWANSAVLAERTADAARVKDVLAESLRVANTIENASKKASLLAAIANNYGRLSDHHHYQDFSTQLFKAADEVHEPDARHWAFTAIAKAAANSAYKMGTSGNLEQTVAVASTLQGSWIKANVLIAAAGGYAQLSDQEKAQDLLAQALAVIDIEQYTEEPYAHAHERVFSSFVTVSKMLSEESQQQLLAHFLRLGNRIQDRHVRADLLFSIAGKYGEGYEVNANMLLEVALSTVESLPGAALNTAAPVQMLKLMAYTPSSDADVVAEPLRTFDFLQRVLSLTDGLESNIALAEDFWHLLPAITIGLGNEAYSRDLLTQLETIAAKSNDPLTRMYVSTAIAKIYASLSNEAIAKDWLAQALAAGRQIDDDYGRLETVFFTAATVLYGLSDDTAADALLDDWLSIIVDMQASYRGEGLVSVAYGASRLSDAATVQSLVSDVIDIATTIDDGRYRADALGFMAWSVATMTVGEEIVR